MRVVLYFDSNNNGTIEQGFVNVTGLKILDRGVVSMAQGNDSFFMLEVNRDDKTARTSD